MQHQLSAPTEWMTEHWALALLSFGFIYLSICSVYRLAFSPLDKYPGPFWAKLTDFWRSYVVARGDQHETLLALHKNHGSVVRIGPNELYGTRVTRDLTCQNVYLILVLEALWILLHLSKYTALLNHSLNRHSTMYFSTAESLIFLRSATRKSTDRAASSSQSRIL